jgi:hypothetical protein
MDDCFEDDHGLDPYNAMDALEDADDDGFTNIEEYTADPRTDVLDPNDFPDPHAKLRLARIIPSRSDYLFQGVQTLPDGSLIFQLNLPNADRTYFSRLGETNLGYVLKRYLPDADRGPTLVLTRGDAEIPLVKGQEKTEYEYTALLVFLIERRGFRAKLGETFRLKSHPYKVVDISRRAVRIQSLKTSKLIVVGRLTKEEYDILRGRPSRPQVPEEMMGPGDVPFEYPRPEPEPANQPRVLIRP